MGRIFHVHIILICRYKFFHIYIDQTSVNQCRYYLGGIITDQINDKELIEVKPAPYNVLLEDDTYKGQIVIGFKFIVNVS